MTTTTNPTTFTVTDRRRNATGCRKRTLRFPDHSNVVVMDWSEDERIGPFGAVDIHPAPDADLGAQCFPASPGRHREFVTLNLGDDYDITVYCSPEQARSLADSILRALDVPGWINADRKVVGDGFFAV